MVRKLQQWWELSGSGAGVAEEQVIKERAGKVKLLPVWKADKLLLNLTETEVEVAQRVPKLEMNTKWNLALLDKLGNTGC